MSKTKFSAAGALIVLEFANWKDNLVHKFFEQQYDKVASAIEANR